MIFVTGSLYHFSLMPIRGEFNFAGMMKSVFIITAGILLACCQQPGEHNARLVQRYFNEVWNKGDTALLDSLLAPGYINHTPSSADAGTGIAGLKTIVMAIRKGFPDLHYEIQDLVVTPNRVVARVIMTGTQTDSLFNLPPTGRKVQVNQINIEEIVDDRMSEHWRTTDELTLMKQLGFVP